MAEGLRVEFFLDNEDDFCAVVYQEFDATDDYLLVQVVWQEMCWCCGQVRAVFSAVTVEPNNLGGNDVCVRGFGVCLMDIVLGEPCPHNADGASEEPCQHKGQHDANCREGEE
jgi:hypothetical protein